MTAPRTICTVEAISRALHQGLDDTGGSSEMLAHAVEEAYALATAAYVNKDAASFTLAEQVLTTINVGCSFSPPTSPVLAVVWTVLSRTKLTSLFDEYGGCPPCSLEEMTSRMRTAVGDLGAYNHFVLGEIMTKDHRGLKIHVKNWFGTTYGFTHQLAALSQMATGEARKTIIENLADEFTGEPHDDMRARFLRKLDLQFDPTKALSDPDRVIEGFSLTNFRTAVCWLPRPNYGLGSFYAIEANFPREAQRMLTGLSGLGFDADSLAIFQLHVGVDDHHSEEWLEVLQKVQMTPNERALVVDGAVTQLHLRRKMFDAVGARIRSFGDAG
jgi:hypothetical protein